MLSRWLDTATDKEAAAHAADFWSAMKAELDTGEFWADRIKRYPGDPAKRLREAMDNLPLPAAFREAAIATRALIREKRKSGQADNEELTLLYWLAAIDSFMLDYAPRLQEPGFNVVETIPGKRVRSLAFTYSELGYRNLRLLNKTDQKWLVEAWGHPASHSTLNALHSRVWAEYEEKLIQERSKQRNAFP